MTISAARKMLNIRRSFCAFFKIAFENTYSMQGKVNYGDAMFDASALNEWVDIVFLDDGAGKRGFSMVQIDAITLIAGRRSGGDRFGTSCAQLADKIHQAMHVDSIPLYDFIDVTNPALLSKKKIVVRNSRGIFREPEEIRSLSIEEGMNRIVFTYRILTLADFASVPSFYD